MNHMLSKNIIAADIYRNSDVISTLSESARLPTSHGEFKMRVFKDGTGMDHVIIYKGKIRDAENIDVRVHSECMTSEVFRSLKCDCNEQLAWALDHIEKKGVGLVIYLRQEGRGIGLFNKIRAYALQDAGHDTITANTELGFEEDQRTYEVAVQLLEAFRIKSINLITNNPLKIGELRKYGINIKRRIPIHIKPNVHNKDYIKIKMEKMNHLP
ncbi:MAG: GTP cyclohydrolase II [Gammaproteobacteria bacterium]|nr:GTP cyclohydrolase II [Gammaproteobacteria bacterium]